MPSRILVLHGPNLNLLLDLPDIDAELEDRAREAGVDLKTFQANSEGALVDALHAERTRVSAVIVNAGKLAPSAEVLAETLSLIKRPAIEVMTDGSTKSRSALKDSVRKQLTGKGGYLAALELLLKEIKSDQGRPTGSMHVSLGNPNATVTDPLEDEDQENTGPIDKEAVKKTLGRKPPAEGKSEKATKTIGRSDGTVKTPNTGSLTRQVVREKISERLSGKLSHAGLSTWARGEWQQIQRGAPVESGQRERLEDVLQTLLLGKSNDHQLIELMTQL